MKKRNSMNGKRLALILGLVLVFSLALGGTLAYLTAKTSAVENTFIPGRVTCEIEEKIEGTTKKDVQVKNTGNTAAFIRAAVVMNWVDSEGNVSGTPVQDTDYTVDLNSTDWTKIGNYYYHKTNVLPDHFTKNLINSCSEIAEKVPSGYHLQVTILAEAIQSQPKDAIKESWKVDPDTWQAIGGEDA